jgi:cytochrome c biogenesis protein CcdA/thiol-disulfide isomerase/thioredoxin
LKFHAPWLVTNPDLAANTSNKEESKSSKENSMAILILFAFLGGVITILSPCILPVLPIVLSGGLASGKTRPLGIVTGFVAGFTVFTLALSAVVRVTGISADALRYLAVGIILFFGLVLTIPRLHDFYSIIAGKISTHLQRKTKPEDEGLDPDRPRDGFWGGTVVGLGLGLVWTPCVGPIMASVISLALTQSVDAGAVFIAAAYSLGTAVPMLGVMFGGRALLHRVPLLLRNTGKIQKAFGLLVIFTAFAIGFQWDRKLQAAIVQIAPGYGSGITALENNAAVQKSLTMRDDAMKSGITAAAPTDSSQQAPLPDYGPAPEFVTQGRWYNTQSVADTMTRSAEEPAPPLTMKMLRGKVVLVDFWTYSCINCLRTLPHLKQWHKTFGNTNFVIIGVHAPEFEFEKNPENVRKAIADLGIPWPVVLDNQYRQWKAYDNHYWPAHYFIDARGHLRYRHFGEGAYQKSEEVIRELLKEAGTDAASSPPADEPDIESATPETYLGYARAQGLIATPPVVKDRVAEYVPVRRPRNGEWTLSGKWTITSEYAAPENSGMLQLGFNARDVFLVIEPEMAGGSIQVLVDSKPSENTRDVHNGTLHPQKSSLYHLVRLKAPGPHVLSLGVHGKMRLFAFTFG